MATLLVSVMALAALAVGAGLGYLLGQRDPVMHTTQARCLAAEGTISCMPSDDNGHVDRGADWTYGVPLDVAWTRNGTFSESGRPPCLPPTGRGLSRVVRLTWVAVETEDTSWRDVVAVGC